MEPLLPGSESNNNGARTGNMSDVEEGRERALFMEGDRAHRFTSEQEGADDARNAMESKALEDLEAPTCTGMLLTWLAILWRAVQSLVGTVSYVLALGLYPLLQLVPNSVMSRLGSGLFRLGYWLYLTPVGRWFHFRLVAWSRDGGEGRHSVPNHAIHLSTATVTICPILFDNYAYIVADLSTKKCALVDPSDPHMVLKDVEHHNLTVDCLLVTHRHHDHSGGNLELKRNFPNLRVFGPAKEPIAAVTHPLSCGSCAQVGNTQILAIETPGHTPGHLCYAILRSPSGGLQSADAVFTGDSVFCSGVGASFHGNGRSIVDVTASRLAQIPGDAYVFPVRLPLFRFCEEKGWSKELSRRR